MSFLLQLNTTLKEFDIYFIPIEHDGSKPIAKSLQMNKIVLMLRLTVNMVGNKGVTAIAESLEVSSGGVYLDKNI